MPFFNCMPLWREHSSHKSCSVIGLELVDSHDPCLGAHCCGSRGYMSPGVFIAVYSYQHFLKFQSISEFSPKNLTGILPIKATKYIKLLGKLTLSHSLLCLLSKASEGHRC